MIEVRILDAAAARAHLDDLCALLVDVVAGGASVGFLPPVPDADARRFWDGALAAPGRVLLAGLDGGRLVGSVQLALASWPNQPHRAEVMKLLVHRAARRRGLGRALMLALEDAARARGRSLLTFDTLQGSDAERLYRDLGYTCAGVIPRYALLDGELRATALFYKELA
jgi:GNAT superfamily N-acetyltransferase